ncbi:hypothetical protein BC938DRAFT_483704 [Jimgerdemannia flammicorona]|uniref:BZIP domain-containing protein n=1 Tax=Jimgerdemannia flammicorona TaxID=994334 RepID=A0A433QBJ7_9FUNG|nr:hypothetical protein BC938DRAFT_483704 [Jimgerdemannia flammicorona]
MHPPSPTDTTSTNSPPPSSPGPNQPPLTLAERRHRNKTASAKYRAKKHSQQTEMRSQISALTEQCALLQRQLDDSKRENLALRQACDKLRGKVVAGRMLKRLVMEGAVGERGRKRVKKEEKGAKSVDMEVDVLLKEAESGSEVDDDDEDDEDSI